MNKFLLLINKTPAVIWGIILGFILNEVTAWLREKRKDKKKKLAFRTVLDLEIEQNLSVLNKFWNKIIDIGNFLQDSDEARNSKALKLIETPIPIWSRKVWEGQISYLALSLNVQEIKEIHKLYCNLDTIIAIQSRLEILRNEKDIKIAQYPVAFRSQEEQFQHKSRELVKECEQIVREIVEKGNPIGVRA